MNLDYIAGHFPAFYCNVAYYNPRKARTRTSNLRRGYFAAYLTRKTNSDVC